jgi:hypothetical protein
MKKILLVLGLLLGLVQAAVAETPKGRVIDLLAVGGVSALDVAGSSAVVYSNSFPMGNVTTYSLAVQSTAASNFTITVQNGFVRPTTEGSADLTNYASDSTTPTLTVTDTSFHIFNLSPIISPYARLKITAGSGNNGSNTISVLKVYIPED